MAYALEMPVPQNIDARWDEITPLIEKWLAETLGEYILTDIYQFLISGEWQCWIVKGKDGIIGLALSTITEFPRISILQIIGVAGIGLKEWVHLKDELEDFGRMNGCAKISGYGRLGWERVLKPHGFVKNYSVITKDL